MEEQKHCFENNNHVGNQNNMRLSGKLCDVVIKVNNREFQAHKVILASNLKYFETMFLNSFQESKQDVITMQDVRETDVEAFILYAYTGKILLTENNVLNLFELANYLTEDSIKEACIDFLKKHLKKEDACLAYKLANSTECCSLRNVARRSILSNFKDCSLTADYLSLEFESLKDILSYNRTEFVQPLEILFEGVVRWILHDAIRRRPYVNDVLNQIKITKLKPDYLLQYCCEWIKDQCEIVQDIMTFYHTTKSQQILQSKNVKQSLIITAGLKGKSVTQFYDFMEKKWSPLRIIAILGQNTIDEGTVFNNTFYYTTFKKSGGTELDFQILNPTSMQTTMLTSDCRLTKFSALCADTRRLYFCGGFGQNGNSDQIVTFEPERNLFEILPPMKSRMCGAASIFYQGYLYVVGGIDSHHTVINTVEKYDPDTKVWTTAASMCVDRYYHEVAILDGKLYACGGSMGGSATKSVEVYDPVIDSWQLVASMNKKRSLFLLVAYEDKLWAIGGMNERSVEVYDPVQDQWQMDVEMSAGLKLDYHIIGGLIPTTCVSNDI